MKRLAKIIAFLTGLFGAVLAAAADDFYLDGPAPAPPEALPEAAPASPADELAGVPEADAAALPGAATRPAAAAAFQPRAKVLVLPFEFIGEAPSHAWIGRAIQQNLVADLAQVPGIRPTAARPDPRPGELSPATDSLVAARLGRYVRARWVVSGSYQVAEENLRVVGVVVHARSGAAVGAARVDGSVRDVFILEEQLAARLAPVLEAAEAEIGEWDAEPPAADEPEGAGLALSPLPYEPLGEDVPLTARPIDVAPASLARAEAYAAEDQLFFDRAWLAASTAQ